LELNGSSFAINKPLALFTMGASRYIKFVQKTFRGSEIKT